MRNPIKLAGGAFICVALVGALLYGYSAPSVAGNTQPASSAPVAADAAQPANNVQKQASFGTIVNLALTDVPAKDVQALNNTPILGDFTLLASNTPIAADTAPSESRIQLQSAAEGADGNVQVIEAIVGVFSYPEITVEVNNPVRINFKVSEADLNSCNDEIFMPEWNIKKKLAVGDNFVEFTPSKIGTFKYNCWMDMIRSNIIVVEAAQKSATPTQTETPAPAPTPVQTETPAAAPAQTETPAIANTEFVPEAVAANVVDGVTVIDATVGAAAYPRITVEVGKPVRINYKVSAEDLNSCNNEIVIPEWNIRKSLSVGDNFVEFTPEKTGAFTYSCWMDMIRSTITVVEQGGGEIGATPLTEAEMALQSTGCCTSGGCGMMGGFFGR